MLFMGGAATFFEFIDKAINDELFVKEREYQVNVNVYEMKTISVPELAFDIAFEEAPDLEKALRQYFIERENALGMLLTRSESLDAFSNLYERYSVSKAVDLLVLEKQIQSRRQAGIDFRFDECDVALQLVSISFAAKDFVELRVLESFATVFNGVPDKLSSYAGVEHFFVFDKKGGNWQIKRHQSNSALSLYITGELRKLVAADGIPMSSLDAYAINDYVAQLRAVLDRDVYFYDATDETSNSDAVAISEDEPPLLLYYYDRNAATEYARRFTHRERVRRNHDFMVFERNSTNFTSQCLLSGGIPLNSRWSLDEGLTARENFTNAAKFFDYIFSPKSHIYATLCDYRDGEPGDIIQFIDGGGEAMFSALITSVVYGNSSDDIEFLITANSEDFRNFPLSALGFDIMRIIKIHGYFEDE